jgi:hypothetical protein
LCLAQERRPPEATQAVFRGAMILGTIVCLARHYMPATPTSR